MESTKEASPAQNIDAASVSVPIDDNPTNLIKNPASPWTALGDSVQNPKKMRFFGMRFMSIWVLPMAVTGIVMEFVFISPLRGVNPFN